MMRDEPLLNIFAARLAFDRRQLVALAESPDAGTLRDALSSLPRRHSSSESRRLTCLPTAFLSFSLPASSDSQLRLDLLMHELQELRAACSRGSARRPGRYRRLPAIPCSTATASPASLLPSALSAASRTSLAFALACSSRYDRSSGEPPRHSMAATFTSFEPSSSAFLTVSRVPSGSSWCISASRRTCPARPFMVELGPQLRQDRLAVERQDLFGDEVADLGIRVVERRKRRLDQPQIAKGAALVGVLDDLQPAGAGRASGLRAAA